MSPLHLKRVSSLTPERKDDKLCSYNNNDHDNRERMRK